MRHLNKTILIWMSVAIISPAISATPTSNIYSTSFAILSYAKWQSPVPKICVVNNANFAQQLKKHIPPKTTYKISNIQSHEIQSFDCSALFFSNLSDKEEQLLLNTTVTFPALSLSTNNSNCETGSAFCLYKKDTNYSFKVNMESLTQSQIHIDPRVLLLAKKAESDQ